MNQPAILDLLENNARLTSQDLADILNEDKEAVEAEIQKLENEKIICGCLLYTSNYQYALRRNQPHHRQSTLKLL